MVIETGKLYFTKAHTSQNIGQTARLELKGTVSLTIYGSDEEASGLVDVADLTPVSEPLTADFFYPLDTLPKYIAFIGTADRINIEGYDLTYIRDVS